MNIDEKILNKILINLIQQYNKRIKNHKQVGFIPNMQAWFNFQKINQYNPSYQQAKKRAHDHID